MRMEQPSALAENTARFTETELEVLRLLVKGLANKEIARRLKHSHNTTRAHLRNIFRKLKTSNRAETARVFGSTPQ